MGVRGPPRVRDPRSLDGRRKQCSAFLPSRTNRRNLRRILYVPPRRPLVRSEAQGHLLSRAGIASSDHMTVDDKTILITGGTGSFGQKFVELLLKTQRPQAIRIYSRDEWKQVQMQTRFDDSRLRFLIGDVRDRNRLYRALNGVDVLIHAAALKQVPVAEYNPIEAVRTNIEGAVNVIDAAIDNGVPEVIAPGAKRKVIGIRPGEKLHEVLLTEEEAVHAREFEDHFVIEPEHPFWSREKSLGGKPLPAGFRYTSDGNSVWLTPARLKEMLKGL